jgi:hypothetical protein
MTAYVAALLAIAATLILHVLGIQGSYYWLEGFDILVHFVGGLGAGFGAAAVLGTLFPSMRPALWKVLALVLLTGLVWEVFEAIYDLLGYPFGSVPYYIDTVKDLIMDTAGGAVAFAALRMFRRKNTAEPIV